MQFCHAATTNDDAEECDEEEEALDRYAPSQAGRTVAGLQHTASHHRAPRPPPSNDTGTTHDGDDDWHRSRSLFNVVWPDQDDSQQTVRRSAEPALARRTSSLRSARSTRSAHSFRSGSDNNV